MAVNKWIFFGVGLLLLALLTFGIGTFLLFVLPPIVRTQIEQQTRLGHDPNGSLTKTTEQWLAPSYKMSMNIWTFSVINPDKVISGEKPIVVEKGPYSFKEIQHKEATFIQNDTRVFYKNIHYYYFDQESSCSECNLNDIVTVPNFVLQNILDAVKGNIIARSVFDAVFKQTGEKVFVTTSVRELLFDGYSDPLTARWCKNLMKPICDALHIPSRIGLFYGRNGTSDGQYEIDTGMKSSSNIGKVFSFNGMKTVKAWYGPYAKMINGTDGQLFAPGLDRRDSKTLQLFIGQICRTIELEYGGKDSYEDVPVYLYHPAKSMNNVDNQRSLGFCNPETPIYFNNTYIQQHGCLPAGVMDVSSCLPGNPKIYMSQPHFFGSSAALREALVGMREPNAEDDQTTIGIEPASGAVVFAQQRTQLNLGIINGKLISLKTLPNQIIPIVRFNETASFDSDTREQLLGLSHIRSRTFIAGIFMYILLGAAIVGIIAIVIIYKRRSQQEEFGHRLLFNDDEEETITIPTPNAQNSPLNEPDF